MTVLFLAFSLAAQLVPFNSAESITRLERYTRAPLGRNGGGHISPLGAYDQASDSFLILDVNPNEGKTWVWAPAAQLLGAMRTKDTIENRGFLLVKEGAKK